MCVIATTSGGGWSRTRKTSFNTLFTPTSWKFVFLTPKHAQTQNRAYTYLEKLHLRAVDGRSDDLLHKSFAIFDHLLKILPKKVISESSQGLKQWGQIPKRAMQFPAFVLSCRETNSFWILTTSNRWNHNRVTQIAPVIESSLSPLAFFCTNWRRSRYMLSCSYKLREILIKRTYVRKTLQARF